MEVRFKLTKYRVAMAALFVLAGVGLGNLLSPLVGNALATVGQTVNISDHSSSAFFAKVTSAGELKTNGVVSGKVAPALPPQPFSVERSFGYNTQTTVLGPTTATVALTDLSFSNNFGNQARMLDLVQVSATAPNAVCSAVRARGFGNYNAPSAQTVVQDFTTPIVLKPLASGDAWCLVANLLAPSGDSNFVIYMALGGYVESGTFTPPTSAPPPGKAGGLLDARADPAGGRTPSASTAAEPHRPSNAKRQARREATPVASWDHRSQLRRPFPETTSSAEHSRLRRTKLARH